MRTIRDAVTAYLESLDAAERSFEHIKSQNWRLSRLVDSLGDQPLSSLDRLNISRVLRPLRDSDLSPASVNGIRSGVKSLLKFCYENGWTDENLGSHIKVGQFNSQRDKSAPEAHIQAVIQAIPQFIVHRKNRLRDIRDALTVSLSIDSGKRLGEINRITRRNLNLALQSPQSARGRTVYHVQSQWGKRGPALITFYEETADLFNRWLTASSHIQSKWVFCSLVTGDRLLPSSQSRAFDRLCKFADVPIFRSHAIRHANANQLFDAGVDAAVVARVLGHTNPHTTLTHYRGGAIRQADMVTADLADRRRGKNDLTQEFFRKINQ